MNRRLRAVRLGPRDVLVERRAGGVIHLRSPHALGPYPRHLLERLAYWAERAPERALFAQRDKAGGWRAPDYRAALARAGRGREFPVEKGLSAGRPPPALSGHGSGDGP